MPEMIMQLLPFLIPIAIIQLLLLVISIVHILRHNTYRIGNRVIWIIICLCINIIGPILYFTLGKGDE